jgi:hypothetical protein
MRVRLWERGDGFNGMADDNFRDQRAILLSEKSQESAVGSVKIIFFCGRRDLPLRIRKFHIRAWSRVSRG